MVVKLGGGIEEIDSGVERKLGRIKTHCVPRHMYKMTAMIAVNTALQGFNGS